MHVNGRKIRISPVSTETYNGTAKYGCTSYCVRFSGGASRCPNYPRASDGLCFVTRVCCGKWGEGFRSSRALLIEGAFSRSLMSWPFAPPDSHIHRYGPTHGKNVHPTSQFPTHFPSLTPYDVRWVSASLRLSILPAYVLRAPLGFA